VKYFRDFLSQQELDLVQNDYEDAIKNRELEVNKFRWQPYLYSGFTGSVYMADLSRNVHQIILNKFNSFPACDNIGIKHYIWDYRSGINWHHDDHTIWAATLYLNEEWKLDWGGFFLFKDENNSVQTMYPCYNCLVLNDNKIEHKVTAINKKTQPMRHTLQIFAT
jgi:hypothetical protein